MKDSRRFAFLPIACFLAAIAANGKVRGESSTPVVVLIGDSIRLGYAPMVAEQLKGVATVVSVPENGGDSSNVLEHLDAWAVAPKPAVIHFNAGLHDLRTDSKTGTRQVELDAYRANLEKVVARLKGKTSARLIFATTTPVIDARHQANKAFVRHEADVREYNKVALEVMKATPAVAIDDLHGVAERIGVEGALVADGVHFTKAGSLALADQVTSKVKAALKEVPATKEAVCRWTESAPRIDGKPDEAVWEKAQVIDRFPSFWSNTDTGTGTRARLLWDADAFYFTASMTDAEMRAFGDKRNDHLWDGDVFELFFKPSSDRPEYYEFQVNPKSVILELPIPKRGFDFNKLAALPPHGFFAVAVVDGTLDKPGDKDKGWTVEGRIPWSAFSPTGGRPKAGATWNFALCRYDYGPDGTDPILMSSAPLTQPNFHRYEDYGKLLFEGPAR